MPERMRESVFFPGGDSIFGGGADTYDSGRCRCVRVDMEELGAVHTDSRDCSGDNVLVWNNQNICIIKTAWDQMACYRNTVRMDTCGTFDSPWQTDKACICLHTN